MTVVQAAVIGHGSRPKRRGASLPAALHAFAVSGELHRRLDARFRQPDKAESNNRNGRADGPRSAHVPARMGGARHDA